MTHHSVESLRSPGNTSEGTLAHKPCFKQIGGDGVSSAELSEMAKIFARTTCPADPTLSLDSKCGNANMGLTGIALEQECTNDV